MKKVILLLCLFKSIYSDQEIQNLHRYILANYYQFAHDLTNAGQWYAQLTPNTNYNYIYLGYIPFLAATESYKNIISLIPKLDPLFKTNQEIQQLFALALERTGQKDEASRRLVLLNEQHKSNQELAFKVAQLYIERAEPENALKVIDNLLNVSPRKPNNYIFHFMKCQIYVQINKKEEALNAIKLCIETYPKFDKSWLLYAVLHEQAGRLEEAIKGYTTYLEMSPEANVQIQQHLLSLAVAQKLAHKTGGKSTNSASLDTAINLFDKKEYAKAQSTLNNYLAQSPQDIQARLLKIQILAQQKQFNQAASLLADWAIKEDNSELWLSTLHLLCYIGLSYKTALQTFQFIQKKKGVSAQLLLYQADLALKDNNSKLALEILIQTQPMVSNATLKTHIAMQIGIIYYDQRQWKRAQTVLEHALTFNYDYPPLYNLLAYLYATKIDNITNAREFIDKALSKDPDNPHFLDTKALVLYKQNDYDQAVKILQKAAASCPTDFTILNHLSKCYYKKGNTDLALQSIKAAKEIAKTNKQKAKAETLLAQWKK